MISAHTAAAVRAAEEPLLRDGRGAELMLRASHGLALGVVKILRSRGCGIYGSRVLVLAGSGNNGADALYTGAYLAARGARTTAVLTGARNHPEALAAFRRAGGRCVRLADAPQESAAADGAARADTPEESAVRDCATRESAARGSAAQADAARGSAAQAALWDEAVRADAVLDGLLGTGGRGGLRGAAAEFVARLQALEGSARPAMVACDLPSGVDATTGAVHGPVLRADKTVTFGAHKSGLLAAPGEQFCGAVELIDIGIAGFLGEAAVFRLEPADLGTLLPQPAAAGHKYTRGVVGVVAGSRQYPGAGLLAVSAASACGPGMVRYVGAAAVASAIHGRNPEVVCSEDSPAELRVQAWLVGPGIDGDNEQRERAVAAIASGLPTVVDAGALELVTPSQNNPAGTDLAQQTPAQQTDNAQLILTPHAGELAAMMARAGIRRDRASVEAEPLAAARAAAELFGAVVLLKGATTVVAAPGGRVFTQANGTARLGTAGSGDTLAGILVALLAMAAAEQPLVPHDLARTAALAAALHGELSRTDMDAPLNAGELAGRIPHVWAQLCQIRPQG
ncbi:hypothetical protein AS189_05445 [Arthrobacter alpinus]|uniref:Bifunctional NAD(P)H-hydrate repair enzyme n=1 Tax=Arthrobacter alpinus TaxID=656366 RepID=A0A0S2LX89_9MICC|nr:NAD(P)H-hydrate dehydratase [Arthrobacter alpinus]ALO66044.1 hypothetical protein AS189_05445 [Arthrobacter alpinus]